jgi:hypothetical protein
MGFIDKPELWHDFFILIGTSAGALVGLLFIVVSLHIDKIAERADHNVGATIEGARNNTLHLLTVLVESAVVLSPQPLVWIGVELIAIDILGLRIPLTFIFRYFNKNITISLRGGFPMGLLLTMITAYLIGITGGVILVTLANWGLFLVAISCVVRIVRAVLTAWMLMFGILRTQEGPKEGER